MRAAPFLSSFAFLAPVFSLPCAPHGLHALQGEYPCFTAAARVANVMRLLC